MSRSIIVVKAEGFLEKTFSYLEKSFFLERAYSLLPKREGSKKNGILLVYGICAFLLLLSGKPFVKSTIPSLLLVFNIALGLVLIFLFSQAFLTKKDVRFDKVAFGIVVFFMVMSVPGAMYGYWQFGNLWGILSEFFLWVSFFTLCFIAGNIKEKILKEEFLAINLLVATGLAVFALYGFFITKSGYISIEGYEDITMRAASLLLNPNALAGYLGITILASLPLLRSKRYKKIVLLVMPMCLLAFFLTFSRGAIVAFLIGLLYLVVRMRNKKVIILSIVTLFILSLLAFLMPSSRSRIVNITNPTHILYSSENGRIWSLKNVNHIMNNDKAWAFGLGLGSYGGPLAYEKGSVAYFDGLQNGFKAIGNTDNQWLQIYAQQGLVGILLFLLFLSYVWRRSKDLSKKAFDYHFIVPIVIVFFGMDMLFADALQFPAVACLFFSLMGAAIIE